MLDPFATALGALFRAPGTVAAEYAPAIGSSVETRAVRSQPTVDLALGDTTVPVGSDIVQLQRSDVPAPRAGDTLLLGDFAALGDSPAAFEIAGTPRLDADGLCWSCEIVPA